VLPKSLREMDAWLAPYRAQWESSLDALDHHLEGMGGNRDEASPPGGTPS